MERYEVTFNLDLGLQLEFKDKEFSEVYKYVNTVYTTLIQLPFISEQHLQVDYGSIKEKCQAEISPIMVEFEGLLMVSMVLEANTPNEAYRMILNNTVNNQWIDMDFLQQLNCISTKYKVSNYDVDNYDEEDKKYTWFMNRELTTLDMLNNPKWIINNQLTAEEVYIRMKQKNNSIHNMLMLASYKFDLTAENIINVYTRINNWNWDNDYELFGMMIWGEYGFNGINIKSEEVSIENINNAIKQLNGINNVSMIIKHEEHNHYVSIRNLIFATENNFFINYFDEAREQNKLINNVVLTKEILINIINNVSKWDWKRHRREIINVEVSNENSTTEIALEDINNIVINNEMNYYLVIGEYDGLLDIEECGEEAVNVLSLYNRSEEEFFNLYDWDDVFTDVTIM